MKNKKKENEKEKKRQREYRSRINYDGGLELFAWPSVKLRGQETRTRLIRARARTCAHADNFDLVIGRRNKINSRV